MYYILLSLTLVAFNADGSDRELLRHSAATFDTKEACDHELLTEAPRKLREMLPPGIKYTATMKCVENGDL